MNNKDLTVSVFILGVWSFFGVELKKPIISEKALKYNFTI